MFRSLAIHIKKNQFATKAFLEKAIVEEKFNNPLGAFLFTAIALLVGFLMSRHLVLGLGLTGAALGITVVMVCLSSAETGLYINMVYGFFGFHLSRWLFHDGLPVGVFSDILVVATVLSFVINKKSRVYANDLFRSPVAKVFVAFFCFTTIELFNPDAHSFSGWFVAFRKIVGVLLILYIAYNVFDSYEKIRKYLTLLFILAAVTGLYGCIQEWHGLFGFEMEWVTGDEHRFGLMFINGSIRKMGTMSDPAEYSIVMASCAVLFIILATTQKKIFPRLVMLAGCLFMLLGMGYSGTRTANAMAVGGLAVYVLLTITRGRTMLFAIIGGFIFAFLLYGPINNPTIYRFRSTFAASDDASYNVREKNRKHIQPYIYSHPLGGGFGTSGAVGKMNNPGHYLAGFETDSGYLKKAVESGWLGLVIVCVLYFTTLQVGIRGYFSSRNDSFKHIYAASVACIFSYYIAEFSQSAIGQITDIFVYYPVIAILMKLKHIHPHAHLKTTVS